MEKKRKLLVFDQEQYAYPFIGSFDIIHTKTKKELIDGIKKCDVVMFTGGSDVSPCMYGEPIGRFTAPYPERDKFEEFVWNMAIQHKVPTLGICRGMQFGCVMSGGKLVQHSTGHTGGAHLVEDIFGNNVLIQSTHHQMVRPETVEQSVVVGYAKGQLSNQYLDGFDKEIYPNTTVREPEIVYFGKTQHLGIQGHPEMSENKAMHKYCCDLVKYYLFDDKSETPTYRV